MKFVYFSLAVSVMAFLVLFTLRQWDGRADRREWARLAALQPKNPARYDPAMVADLPEPVQRFFHFAIKPGSPLLTVAEIHMGGEFTLGTRENPNNRPMLASQILAAPTGFLWKLEMPGTVSVSGSDSASWTRFWVLGLIPVARAGGDRDHARAAYGRYVAEAVFWTPAAMLPGPGILWQALDQQTIRVTVTHKELSQAVDVTLNTEGQPVAVQFMRWTNANPEKKFRLQPFGGHLSDFREVQGFRVPFHVEAGNMFGTDQYHAFFRAKVKAVRFPTSGS